MAAQFCGERRIVAAKPALVAIAAVRRVPKPLRLAAVTNASGFVVQYAYDIMDRVTNISWRTTSGATIGGFAYEYDALGRITSRSQTLGTNAFDCVYTYDDLDRLASDGDVAYTYDAAGNRMTRTDDGETITESMGTHPAKAL